MASNHIVQYRRIPKALCTFIASRCVPVKIVVCIVRTRLIIITYIYIHFWLFTYDTHRTSVCRRTLFGRLDVCNWPVEWPFSGTGVRRGYKVTTDYECCLMAKWCFYDMSRLQLYTSASCIQKRGALFVWALSARQSRSSFKWANFLNERKQRNAT